MDVPKSLFKILMLAVLVILVGCSAQSQVVSLATKTLSTEESLTASLAGAETQTLILASKSLLTNFLGGAPTRVQEAYQFAIAYPHELEKYPCYCGCGAMDHKRNLDCYIKDVDEAGKISFDNHASGCGICVDITQDVMRLMREGMRAKQIRSQSLERNRRKGARNALSRETIQKYRDLLGASTEDFVFIYNGNRGRCLWLMERLFNDDLCC